MINPPVAKDLVSFAGVAYRQMDRRRLAGAVGPEKAEDFALLNRQRKIVERQHRAIALSDVREFEDGSH